MAVQVSDLVIGNPSFAADGFHLNKASPAINQGVASTVTNDIDGDTRDALPDIGADEYRPRIYLASVK